MSNKIKIEKNSVQETLLVPLYGRKMCAEKFPELYNDTSARELCEHIDYDFSDLEAKKGSFFYEFGALEAAMRQLDIMWEIREYLKQYPKAAVVNLGCGLDQTGRACDNGSCRIFNLDFPEIIAARNELLPAGDREEHIAADLKDHRWMDRVDGTNGVIFFAAGVFHYFKAAEVKSLVQEMAEHYPGGRLIFDTVGKLGLKLMMSGTLKSMGIDNVEGMFYVDKPGQELQWGERIRISSKGYMLGYYDMKSPGIRAGHRFLAHVGDDLMHMAVHRAEFAVPVSEKE
ncbi:MAG: class I SAM-dependent methyltransferase [Lachnospiraceae bacterium]|nr:class I SAM-dependent methyltransferase [Lachnospiraceae bacterium]